MSLSKDAQTYLDHFDSWDADGPTMRDLWAKTSPAEREEIRGALRERMHEKNARHAEVILRNLPRKWREVIGALIDRLKDELP